MTDAPKTPPESPEQPEGEAPEDGYSFFYYDDLDRVVRRGQGGLGHVQIFTGQDRWRYDDTVVDVFRLATITPEEAAQIIGEEALNAPDPPFDDDTAPEDSEKDKAEDKTEDTEEGQDGD